MDLGQGGGHEARVLTQSFLFFTGTSLGLPSLLAGQGLLWSSWEVPCSLAPVLAVKAKPHTVHPAPTLSRILPRSMCEVGCSACGKVWDKGLRSFQPWTPCTVLGGGQLGEGLGKDTKYGVGVLFVQ